VCSRGGSDDCREDLNDPHAAAMWDSCAYGVVLANVDRTWTIHTLPRCGIRVLAGWFWRL